MKNINRLISSVLVFCMFDAFVLPLHVFARSAQNLQESEEGYLVLETKHRGLEVRIDDKFVGFTPLEAIELPSGLHKVYVTNPNRMNWLDQDWFADVRISPQDTLRVPVIFKRSYSINSQPYGATVLFRQQKLGETPIFFNLNEDEIGTLTLIKEGYIDTSFVIGLSDQRYFSIALKQEAKPLDLTRLSSDTKLDRRPKTKLYLYSTIGLTLVSGALALYFRNRGNSSYDRYLETGDPKLMNKFINDAKRYDRFAAASFGIFQVSFIASFYLFLKQANR